MKNFMYLFLALSISIAVVSCGNKKDKEETKKAENLADLKTKYDGKQFKDCDEYFAAADEMLDVMVATVKQADAGDEKAKAEFKDLVSFLGQFETEREKYKTECPDKFKEFEKKSDEKAKPIEEAIMKLTFDMMQDEMPSVEDSLQAISNEVENKIEGIQTEGNNKLDALKKKK